MALNSNVAFRNRPCPVELPDASSIVQLAKCLYACKMMKTNASAFCGHCSQLYRSSSFNSSGRNSSSGESDDMHADLSLEEDVLDLNHKVRICAFERKFQISGSLKK